MRKFLLSILALVCSATVWAEGTTRYEVIDSVPVPKIMQNISYNVQRYELSFDDTFGSMSIDRQYNISAYVRTPATFLYKYKWAYWTEDVWSYFYGTLRFPESDHPEPNVAEVAGELSNTVYNVPAGHRTINIKSIIDSCYAKGETELHICICGMYTDPVTGYYKYMESEKTGNETMIGLYLNNAIDVSLPHIAKNYITVPSEIRYGQQYQLTANVMGMGQMRYYWQRKADDESWQTFESGSVSTADARNGKKLTYKAVFTQTGVSQMQYRLILSDVATGEQNESTTKTAEAEYPLNLTGAQSWKKKGDTFTLSKPNDCYEWIVSSSLPLTLTPNGDYLDGTMPGCPVSIYEEAAKYTVKFLDYDYSVINEQQVDCGNNATPPANPSHSGMTFSGWDGSYNNIHANTVVRATYTVDGVEAKLSVDGDLTSVNQGEKVNLNIYVKTPSAVITKAYIQNALLSAEDQELEWSENSTAINFTAAQASAGTTQTKSGQTVFGSDKGRARYFRLRIRLSGSTNDIYSNTIRIDTYYPIDIYSSTLDLVSQTDREELVGNGTIYSRPLDTVWVRNVDSEVCNPALSLASGDIGSVKGSDERGAYVVMPAELGENGITATPQKYTVLFYAAGHVDGYWNTIYGDGVYEPQNIDCGAAATLPEVEVAEGVIFNGWKAKETGYADDAYLEVTRDMSFIADMSNIPMFTVTFKEWDGAVLKTDYVYEGENATPPEVSEREGYTFSGWDGSYKTVTENRILIAQYEEIPQGIEEVKPTSDSSLKSRANKVVRDGVLYIERNGKTYNAQGAEVK